jgi:hypothetical protein
MSNCRPLVRCSGKRVLKNRSKRVSPGCGCKTGHSHTHYTTAQGMISSLLPLTSRHVFVVQGSAIGPICLNRFPETEQGLNHASTTCFSPHWSSGKTMDQVNDYTTTRPFTLAYNCVYRRNLDRLLFVVLGLDCASIWIDVLIRLADNV